MLIFSNRPMRPRELPGWYHAANDGDRLHGVKWWPLPRNATVRLHRIDAHPRLDVWTPRWVVTTWVSNMCLHFSAYEKARPAWYAAHHLQREARRLINATEQAQAHLARRDHLRWGT